MKLTWFGGTTLRIHIGGQILVTDPAGAPAGIDVGELRSGASGIFGLGDAILPLPARWQPRRAASLLNDDGIAAEVLVRRADRSAVVIDAIGEPPLLLVRNPVGAMGRWSRDAVVVVLGPDEQVPDVAANVLHELAPRLIAIAAAEPAVDAAIAAVRNHLGATVLVALEPGLALEV